VQCTYLCCICLCRNRENLRMRLSCSITPINQWMSTQVFCLFRRVRQRSCGPGDHPLQFWNVGPEQGYCLDINPLPQQEHEKQLWMRSMESLQQSLTKVLLQLDDTRPCLEANFVMGVPSISNLDILTSRGSSPKDEIISSDFKSAYSELNNNLDTDVARRTPVSSEKIIPLFTQVNLSKRLTCMDHFCHFGGKTMLGSPFFWCYLDKNEDRNRNLRVDLRTTWAARTSSISFKGIKVNNLRYFSTSASVTLRKYFKNP
jgi:hypothetical protein